MSTRENDHRTIAVEEHVESVSQHDRLESPAVREAAEPERSSSHTATADETRVATAQGDFARGQRHDIGRGHVVYGDFATGMRTTITPGVPGDFATGMHTSSRRTAIGDFATGLRTVSPPDGSPGGPR
jgi:hypothetical protein